MEPLLRLRTLSVLVKDTRHRIEYLLIHGGEGTEHQLMETLIRGEGTPRLLMEEDTRCHRPLEEDSETPIRGPHPLTETDIHHRRMQADMMHPSHIEEEIKAFTQIIDQNFPCQPRLPSLLEIQIRQRLWTEGRLSSSDKMLLHRLLLHLLPYRPVLQQK
jgi:hypothetical protein